MVHPDGRFTKILEAHHLWSLTALMRFLCFYILRLCTQAFNSLSVRVWLPVCLSESAGLVCLSQYFCMSVSVCLSDFVCLSVCLFVCLFVCGLYTGILIRVAPIEKALVKDFSRLIHRKLGSVEASIIIIATVNLPRRSLCMGNSKLSIL